MPTTATADNFSADKIALGPGRLYAAVGVPASGARLVLHSDNTPDTTLNPLTVHLGLTEAGAEVSFMTEIQNFESDEFTVPHLTRIIKEPASIKANLLQVLDFDLVLKYLWPGSSYTTGVGFKQMTVGGLSLVTNYSFVLIAPLVSDATKVMVIQLYKASNRGGVNLTITRKDQSKIPVDIQGLAVTTRAAGDQIGQFWYAIP